MDYLFDMNIIDILLYIYKECTMRQAIVILAMVLTAIALILLLPV